MAYIAHWMRGCVVGILVVCLLTGCKGKDSGATAPATEPSGTSPSQTESISDEYQGSETGIPEPDQEGLEQALELALLQSTGRQDRESYLAELSERSSYHVVEYARQGRVVTAQISVTAPDMYTVAKSLENVTFSSQEDANAQLIHAMDAVRMVDCQVELQFYLSGQKWVPMLTETFVDAYYGGLMTYRTEYIAERSGGDD